MLDHIASTMKAFKHRDMEHKACNNYVHNNQHHTVTTLLAQRAIYNICQVLKAASSMARTQRAQVCNCQIKFLQRERPDLAAGLGELAVGLAHGQVLHDEAVVKAPHFSAARRLRADCWRRRLFCSRTIDMLTLLVEAYRFQWTRGWSLRGLKRPPGGPSLVAMGP